MLSTHRILAYTFLSVLAVSLTVINALRNYSNFYSVAIYLSKSSRSVLVLANFGFLLALLCGHFVQRLFFGSLRPAEVERLYDRLWFFITESLLAFTIFRDEFDVPFALMFGFLLFIKSFHWLASDRIEWMDQIPYPGPPLLFHTRMSILFLILWFTDFIMFLIAVENTLSNGVGGMVLFASEYGILVASVMNTISKYLLSLHDLRRAGRRGGENAPAWENKSMWVFYIELATDFLKLTTYLIFFLIIIAFYGLPLNIVRDVYITARSFITRLRALHRYQTATRNMDQRYPNATEAELHAMNDRTCIICREEMIAREAGQGPAQEGPNVTPKKLPCGHVFHFHCLRSWLERQQSCPTCRRTVLDNNQTPPGQMQGPNANPGLNNGAAAAENGANVQQNNVPGRNPFAFFGRFFAPPVQVPNGPLLPNNLGGLNLAGQIPQEVLIQYRIQYPHQQVAQPPEPLRPLPQFLGFVRPGGAWQPWPVQLEPNNQRGGQDATTAAEGAVPGTDAGDVTDNTTAQNPREAAALAALRRRTGNGSGQDHPSGDASSSVTGTPHPPAGVTEVERAVLPQLIPLYNLNSGPGDPRPDTWSNARSSPPETQNRNISQLPPDLTEAQLGLMDRLTREAIDERLRVLEGVSTAIHRCVDDLMRMRSALPSPSRSDARGAAEAPMPEAGRSAAPGKTVADAGSSMTNNVGNSEPENGEIGRNARHPQQSSLDVDGTNE